MSTTPTLILTALICLALGTGMLLLARKIIPAHAIGAALTFSLPIALLLHPIWISLTWVIVGVGGSAALVNAIYKKPSPGWLNIVVPGALLLSVVIQVVAMNGALDEVKAIDRAASGQAWKRFATRGEAEQFVEANYRQCLDATGFGKPSRYNCRATTVSLASALKGQGFSIQVDRAIEDSRAVYKPTPEGLAQIRKIMDRVGLAEMMDMDDMKPDTGGKP